MIGVAISIVIRMQIKKQRVKKSKGNAEGVGVNTGSSTCFIYTCKRCLAAVQVRRACENYTTKGFATDYHHHERNKNILLWISRVLAATGEW